MQFHDLPAACLTVHKYECLTVHKYESLASRQSTYFYYLILQGGRDYLKGRANNNSVDLNRDFPDLDRIMFSNEARHIQHNNHLMDQLRALDHQVLMHLPVLLISAL